MPRREIDEDDYEEEEEDREQPDESDMDSFDEPGVMPCPHCRQMISEEAEQCPHCRMYVEHDPRKALPTWFYFALLAALIAMLLLIFLH